MPLDSIPFRDTHYFSEIISDYLDQKKELTHFYNRFPSIENFKDQIKEKSQNYNAETRKVLASALKNQYRDLDISKGTQKHIDLLSNKNTFTIVTGHQLNLFTGPLYFFYKIISTVNLCKQLKEKYPENDFVPIYWMASEDHDFEEINYFNFEGKKVQWNRDASGAVGKLHLEGLEHVAEVFSQHLNSSENSQHLKNLFEKAYLNHSDLCSAMKFLVNELFKAEGLVIVDGDDKSLKNLFVSDMQREIDENLSYRQVEETIERLNKIDANYKIQVNPREINLFYLQPGLRERIVESEGRFYVNDSNFSWERDEILKEISEHPERFSPNVIMRPLFQERILPNLCYIGGGGEIAYWLQLKSSFKAYNITFPMLLLRNSALVISTKQKEKLEKLEVSTHELFLSKTQLRTLMTKRISKIPIDFTVQKNHLENQFQELYTLAEKTDASFIGAVSAQERKQINGLEHLEKRLLKAQKRKLHESLDRVSELQNELFPNESLQERNSNFSEFYVEYGQNFKEKLIKDLDPLVNRFLILEI